MKKKIIDLSFILLVAFFVASCGAKKGSSQEEEAPAEEAVEQHDEKHDEQHEEQPADGSAEEGTDDVEKAGIVYHCPMKCDGDKKYAEAGKCSSCGMDLVEVSKDEGGEAEAS